MPTYVQNLSTTGTVRIPALSMVLRPSSGEPAVASGSIAPVHPRIDMDGEPARSQLRILKNRGMIRILSGDEYAALLASGKQPQAPQPPPADVAPPAPTPVDAHEPAPEKVATPEPVVDAPVVDEPDPEPVSEDAPVDVEDTPVAEDTESETEYYRTADELRSLSKSDIQDYIRENGIADEIDLRRKKDSILEQYQAWLDQLG